MAEASTNLARAVARSPVRLRAPLVGRDQELALLEDALVDAMASKAPRTVTLMGAAGLGKSRLCRELLADLRVRHPEIRVLSGQCREGGERYGVMRGILRNRLGIVDGMDADTAARTLRETVGDVIGDRRVGELVQFLGAFLDLELPDSQLVEAMSDDPDQLRQVGRSVLKRFLEADASKQPLVLALDDFHLAHADAASLVHYLGRSITNAPILFVIIARPELFDRHPDFREPGGAAVRLDLMPLDEDASASMLQHLLVPVAAGQEQELAELTDEVIDLAAGNPFLIEHIVRTFIEQGVILAGAPGTPWRLELSRLSEVQLPLSVDDAIAARISALSSEQRALLEMAASMGGVFWLGSLVALERAAASAPRLWTDPGADRKRIAATLANLVERDYVLRLPDASIAGETEYAFKHNLEREALHRYTSRQLLSRHHRVIAQWLEQHLGEGSEEQHELLAQHYDLGGVGARAAQHYLAAAERARMRYAYGRAADYYRRGLKLLGDGDGLARMRALHHFGDALELSGQRDQARDAFEQMRVIAYQLDMVEDAARAHARLGRVERDRAQLTAALEHFDTAQALYEHRGDARGAADALASMGGLQLLNGNLDAAEHMFREAVEAFERLQQERPLLHALVGHGALLRERLRLAEAEDALGRALGLARKLGDDAGAIDALLQLGLLRDRQGDAEHALSLWSEALGLSTSTSDRSRQASVLACLGASAYRVGASAEAVAHLERAAGLAAALGNRLLEADVLRSLGKARALAGDVSGGLAAAQRAIDIFEQAKTRPALGIALRSMAEIAAGAGHDVVAMLERACAIFAEIGSDLELARASLALAEALGRGAGEAPDGRDRAIRAEGLRARARLLLDRHAGLNLRASAVPKRV